MLFGRTAFVAVDVGVVAAQHGMIGTSQRLQPQNIRAGAIEGEENCNVGPEMLFESFHRGAGVGVVSVGDYMALIDASDGLQNLGVHTGIVVAGEGAAGWKNLLHSETM